MNSLDSLITCHENERWRGAYFVPRAPCKSQVSVCWSVNFDESSWVFSQYRYPNTRPAIFLLMNTSLRLSLVFLFLNPGISIFLLLLSIESSTIEVTMSDTDVWGRATSGRVGRLWTFSVYLSLLSSCLLQLFIQLCSQETNTEIQVRGYSYCFFFHLFSLTNNFLID